MVLTDGILPLSGCLAAGIIASILVGRSIMKGYSTGEIQTIEESMESLKEEIGKNFTLNSVEREGSRIIVYLEYIPDGLEGWSRIPTFYGVYEVETRIRGEGEQNYKIK